jgi:hypothetical protein
MEKKHAPTLFIYKNKELTEEIALIDKNIPQLHDLLASKGFKKKPKGSRRFFRG